MGKESRGKGEHQERGQGTEVTATEHEERLHTRMMMHEEDEKQDERLQVVPKNGVRWLTPQATLDQKDL